ncbi:IS1595 family transposase [Edaphocola aurantiacus]|uniref:IS1595 family transposase n=1 Tax=Edaphocola aurantiacus TaxID=2601682 RepID=UPI001C979A85|nr:IS1595 family transposase [Edaphocola aurantiacus]
MELKFKSLRELDIFFKDEKRCKEFYEKVRWNGNITCPKCGHNKINRTSRSGGGYQCASRNCKKLFSVTSGTMFGSTKLPLGVWFTSIYLLCTSKKGISSVQLGSQMMVSQKTAWFMNHRIRKSMEQGVDFSFLTNIIEADETYVGGKVKNMHQSKKPKKSQGRSKYKSSIFGLLQRHGMLRTFVTSDTYKETLQRLIDRNVRMDAVMMTDKYDAYNDLDEKYRGHYSVNHTKKEYVRKEDGYLVHTQSIEGFWSIFKRGYIGIYHYMSKKHLQRYADEFTYRFNTRNKSPMERFMMSLQQASKARLRYKDLIKKVQHEDFPG